MSVGCGPPGHIKTIPIQIEKASTHKSAKIQAGTVFVTCDLDLKELLTPK